MPDTNTTRGKKSVKGKNIKVTWIPIKEHTPLFTRTGEPRKTHLIGESLLNETRILVILSNQQNYPIKAGDISILGDLSKEPIEHRDGVPVYTARKMVMIGKGVENSCPSPKEVTGLKEVADLVREPYQFRIIEEKTVIRIITISSKTASTILDYLKTKLGQQWSLTKNDGELRIEKKFIKDIKIVKEKLCEIRIGAEKKELPAFID